VETIPLKRGGASHTRGPGTFPIHAAVHLLHGGSSVKSPGCGSPAAATCSGTARSAPSPAGRGWQRLAGRRPARIGVACYAPRGRRRSSGLGVEIEQLVSGALGELRAHSAREPWRRHSDRPASRTLGSARDKRARSGRGAGSVASFRPPQTEQRLSRGGQLVCAPPSVAVVVCWPARSAETQRNVGTAVAQLRRPDQLKRETCRDHLAVLGVTKARAPWTVQRLGRGVVDQILRGDPAQRWQRRSAA
jgi:hypothetical protein